MNCEIEGCKQEGVITLYATTRPITVNVCREHYHMTVNDPDFDFIVDMKFEL